MRHPICSGTASIPCREKAWKLIRSIPYGDITLSELEGIVDASDLVMYHRSLLDEISIKGIEGREEKIILESRKAYNILSRYEWWVNDLGYVYRSQGNGGEKPWVVRVPSVPPYYVKSEREAR